MRQFDALSIACMESDMPLSPTPKTNLKPIRIGLQSWGSTGDINPFLSLAAALAAAGHTVTLAITSIDRRDYALDGSRYGFTVRQVGWIGKDVTTLNQMGVRIFRETNPVKQMGMVFNEMLGDNVPAMYAAARQLAAENDLLIGHFIAHPVHLAAEQAGKPYLTITLNHSAIATREAPPYPLPDLGNHLNALLWRLVEWQIDRIALPSVNRLRQTNAAAPLQSLKPVWQSPQGNLIAVSREFATPHLDWGKEHFVCGPLSLPRTQIEPLSPALLDFLHAGPPPVYITFGSMIGLPEASRELEDMLAILLETVRLANCRAIIQAHWSMTGTATDNAQIFRIESIDHRAIFPHCAAVIHHGGAGTCQSVTACGCPSIIVAHVADQFFWGDLLYSLGIAPKKINRHRLTPQRLAHAIRAVLNDDEMRHRAKMIGTRMAAEQGSRNAVEQIEAIYLRLNRRT